MKYAILLSVGIGILSSQMAVAAEGEIPKFDIAAACRASGSVQTPAKCMQDEQAAHGSTCKTMAAIQTIRCFTLHSNNNKPGGLGQLH
jgi:hypothetical protein